MVSPCVAMARSLSLERLGGHLRVMKSMKPTFLGTFAGLLLLCSTSLVMAGGSVDLSDIQPLLQQQPQLWKFFTDHFEISDHGGGARLSIDSPLRGYRFGPYTFPAKVKGSSSDYDLEITVVTDLYFLDAHSKEITDETKAVEKEEVLTGITVGPLKHSSRDGSFVQSAK